MRMFLLSCIALFIVVIITAAVKTRNPNRQATTRKRKRDKKLVAKSLGSNPLDEVKLHANAAEDEAFRQVDANAALGLNTDIDENVDAFETKAQPEVRSQHAPTLEYVVLHVMAPSSQQFGGYELLQALLSNGLRYGDSKVFNMHENKNGSGAKIFSLVSVNQPGTFDLPKMSHFSCPGLTLYMVLKEIDSPREVFDKMLTCARQLAEDLGGEIRDASHKALSMDKITSLRKEIDLSFEGSRTRDLFVDN